MVMLSQLGFPVEVAPLDTIRLFPGSDPFQSGRMVSGRRIALFTVLETEKGGRWRVRKIVARRSWMTIGISGDLAFPPFPKRDPDGRPRRSCWLFPIGKALARRARPSPAGRREGHLAVDGFLIAAIA